MAMGVYGATIGVAVAIGPLVGGALTQWLGWESIFFLNVPIGIAAIVITLHEAARDARPERVADRLGRPRDVLERAVPARARPAARQRRGLGLDADRVAARRRRRPDGRVPRRSRRASRSRCSRCTCSASPPSPACSWRPLGVSASMFALFLYLTLYLQGFLGHDAARGRAALPAADRDELLRRGRDRRAALASARRGTCSARGLGITGLGLLLMGGVARGDDWTGLLPGFILAGVGVGPDQPGDRRRGGLGRAEGARGMASGINDTFRQVGIAIGIAAWGAIFLGRGASRSQQVAAGTPAATGDAAARAGGGGLLRQPRQRRGARAPGRPRRAWRTPPARASSPGSTRS